MRLKHYKALWQRLDIKSHTLHEHNSFEPIREPLFRLLAPATALAALMLPLAPLASLVLRLLVLQLLPLAPRLLLPATILEIHG